MLITLYNRRKNTRWYRVVRSIDRRVGRMEAAEIEQALAHLEWIESQLQDRVSVSDTFMANYYDLRGHIDLMQGRLLRQSARLDEAGADAAANANEVTAQADAVLPAV